MASWVVVPYFSIRHRAMELLVSSKLAHSKFHGIPWNSMELLVWAKLAHSKFHGIPWKSMELLVWAKLAHFKFHGIRWNFSCQQNRRTSSSMEFHGIPWNCSCHRNWRTPSSMEFHGIPWNCSCQRNWRTPSSKEFHGTAHVIEIGALEVPWNYMEPLVSVKLADSKFHGIPWNWSCQRNWRIPSSMEYHGTARVSEIGALEVPWNSMEFHGTARVSEIGALQVPWNSMEFHGTVVSSNWCTRSSMEFHGNAGVSSMEFLGTLFCYLMKSLVSSTHWVLKWYRIPWNLSFKILMKTIFNCAGWINFHKLINTL